MQGVVHIANTAVRAAAKQIFRQQKTLAQASHVMRQMQDFADMLNQEVFEQIKQTIQSIFPEHQIINQLKVMPKESPVTWHILPIDGSQNLLYGSPHFALGVSVQYQSLLQHAVIYTPFQDRLLVASKGQGAQCNEQRLRLPNFAPSLKQALIITDCDRQKDQILAETLHIQHHLAAQGTSIRQYGSCMLGMTEVAVGHCHGFFSCSEKVWSMHPASLLLQEAGGFVTNFTGRPLSNNPSSILAGHGKLLPQLASLTSCPA